ncbi:MAG: TonB-dependent receptor [Wenzhouxiangellaceae bacterium]
MHNHTLTKAIRQTLRWGLLAGIATQPVWADDHEADDHSAEGHEAALEHLTVVADPLGGSILEITRPVDLLAGEYLDDRRGFTLGETLQWQPGIQSTYFGPGAGRPVIRGLSGVRVRVLENNVSTLDAAALSDDHAVAADPLLIDRVEILKGPATLLYGSGAIGGVVNVIDGRIAEQANEQGIHGAVELRGNTVADETTGVFRLDGGHGLFNWHVDGFIRDTDDVSIPGFALTDELLNALDAEEREEQEEGVLNNSFVESSGATAGFSFTGDWGFIGAAFQRFDTEYGIPAELEVEEEGDDDDAGDEEEHGAVRIDLRRDRYDVRAGLLNPFAGIDKVTFKLGTNDYRHLELEGDEIGTRFDIDATEWRGEVVHAPIGNLRGVFGVQSTTEEVIAVGAEAFLPPTDTDNFGVFLMEELDLGAWKISAGGRWEDVEVTRLDGQGEADFENVSFSAGLIWDLANEWQAAFNWSRSERAPTQAELFADGVHVAIQTFEVGNADLVEETANALDFTLHKHVGAFHMRLNLFYNQFDDFIYLADTGMTEDGFPVRVYQQQDADFMGLEAEIGYRFQPTSLGQFEITAQFDTVDGELDTAVNGNDQLPRISPTRYGLGLDWHNGPWRGRISLIHVADVDNTADFETATDSYNLLGVDLAYLISAGRSEWELFLKGDNLLDETARIHTSFLKDFAPLPGINLGFGLRGRF